MEIVFYVLMGIILLFTVCFAVLELKMPYEDDEDFWNSFLGTLIRRFIKPL